MKTVTVDCSEGHIDWSSPGGAVRINLQSYSKAAAFEACFIAKSYFSTIKISKEDESIDQLIQLVKLDNASHAMKRELCFESSQKPVVIYIEAEVGDWQAKTIGHFDLDYDIRRIFPKVKKLHVDDMEGKNIVIELRGKSFWIIALSYTIVHRGLLMISKPTVNFEVGKFQLNLSSIST